MESHTQPMASKFLKPEEVKYEFELRTKIEESGAQHQLGKSGRQQLVYSPYICYLPRDNRDIAISTWDLAVDDLKKLNEDYIISKDLSADEMKRKIRDIMFPLLDLVLAGKEFCYYIPSVEDMKLVEEDMKSMEEDMKSLEDMQSVEYSGELCFPLLKRGRFVKRNFYHGNSTHSAAMTTWVLKTIYENLNSELVLTLRDVFYRCSQLFQTQSASDRTVTDITLMFECTRSSLNLTSEERGSVCGGLRIKLKGDGGILDCTEKAHIPDFARIESLHFDSDLVYIIVVEKGTIFNYLQRLKFHRKERCIIMTANGFPDICTRSFLKLLEKHTALPVFGVADPDPYGFQIMKCYSQGSKNLAHENFNLAVPNLMWVGLTLDDILESGIRLHKHNSWKLKDKDKTVLDNLLKDGSRLSPIWKAGIERMRSLDRKTHFEAMHEKGFHYMADCFLPKAIRRARGVKEQVEET